MKNRLLFRNIKSLETMSKVNVVCIEKNNLTHPQLMKVVYYKYFGEELEPELGLECRFGFDHAHDDVVHA